MINAAIVGLGRWGQNLVNSIQQKSDKIQIVAGTTRTRSKAAAYAQEQGFSLYDSFEQVIADPNVEAIVLATPHTQRVGLIVSAARAQKHVFTEKPFTLNVQDAVAGVNACAENNVILAVGFHWRFQPALREIRRMLDDGRLGKLLHIEGNFCGPGVYRFGADHWRLNSEEGPGGGMTSCGVHVVDAMLYLAGPIETVFAQSHRRVLDYGIDDTTSMLFRFRNGVTAYLGTIIATAGTWRMQVFGSQGWAVVSGVDHLATWQMRVCFVDPAHPNVHRKPETISFPNLSTERAELENFADAIRERRPLVTTDGDEVHGVAVLEAILQSAKTGAVKAVQGAG